MLIFHEGLPGSGKSYEALVTRIIPALAVKRPVDAYVEGLDHARIAQLAQITEAQCRELLVVLTREQVPEIFSCSRDNALVVLDEAQNFWGNRAKLSKEITQYVTEHRHRGQDIVLMGQDLRDVHTLWRRRVELKLRFMKLSGLGTSKRYSVGTFRCVGPDEFEKVGVVVSKYDPKYFGTYKSHVSDDTNKGDYKEQRATIWRHPMLRLAVPVALVGALWGVNSAWKFFHPEPKQTTAAAKPTSVPVHTAASAPQTVAAFVTPPDTRPVQEKRFAKLSTDYRIRLAGLVQRGERVQGVIEWIDGGTRVIERFTLDQMRDLGVGVAVGEGFARLQIGAWSDIATMWPLESPGRVSETKLASMREASPMAQEAPQAIHINGAAMKPAREPAAPLEVDKPRHKPS